VRVLLTGASGFVGSNLAHVFSGHGAEVVAPSHGELDLVVESAVLRSVRTSAPDAIVHAAIWNDPAGLLSDRRRAWEAYVGATGHLVRAANQVGAQLVLISTDWVFDGTQGPAAEDAPPNPVNAYGFLKAASEVVVCAAAECGTVARIAGVQGVHRARPSTPRAQDAGFGYLCASVVEALQAGRRFTVWDGSALNRVATPTLATDAGEMIWCALELRATGILHCCGAEHASRVSLARATARVFGLDESLLDAGEPPSSLVGERIPTDTRLDNAATRERLGVPGFDLEGMLGRLREQLVEVAGAAF
jgi:dTDP-4-dehydrorhamnose reductase